MKNRPNIALIGFMGTGKSTIGKKLARKLDYHFVDLDHYIEQCEKLKIKDIFSLHGEDYFRMRETEVLLQITKSSNQVISTGGGTILKEENRRILMETCFVVNLTAKPKNIYVRVKDSKNRPLLNTVHPERVIRKLLHKRDKYYKQNHLTIKTDVESVNQAVDHIIEEYNKSIDS